MLQALVDIMNTFALSHFERSIPIKFLKEKQWLFLPYADKSSRLVVIYALSKFTSFLGWRDDEVYRRKMKARLDWIVERERHFFRFHMKYLGFGPLRDNNITVVPDTMKKALNLRTNDTYYSVPRKHFVGVFDGIDGLSYGDKPLSCRDELVYVPLLTFQPDVLETRYIHMVMSEHRNAMEMDPNPSVRGVYDRCLFECHSIAKAFDRRQCVEYVEDASDNPELIARFGDKARRLRNRPYVTQVQTQEARTTQVRSSVPPTLEYADGPQASVEYSIGATAGNFNDCVYPNMPLCMKRVEDKYQRTKSLGYYETLQLGLYLKGCGMTQEDVLEHFTEAVNFRELERNFKGFYKNDIHPCKCETIQGYSKTSKTTKHTGLKVQGCPWDDFGNRTYVANLAEIGITDPEEQCDVMMDAGFFPNGNRERDPYKQTRDVPYAPYIACSMYHIANEAQECKRPGQPGIFIANGPGLMLKAASHPNAWTKAIHSYRSMSINY